jgi:hypothetical protein
MAPALHATPKIESISGELVNDATLTVSGSAFSEVDNPISFYDQVDNQPAYQTLADGAPVPLDQGIWTTRASKWGNPVEIVRTGDLRTDGASAAYFGQRKADLGWPSLLKDSQTKSLYVSWWYKPSKAIDQGGSNKFIRIWDKTDGSGTRISWTQMHMTYSVPDLGYTPHPSWSETQPTPGEWNRFEIYADGETNTIIARMNGLVKHSISDFQKSSSFEGLTIGLIGFDPSVSTPYADFSFRMKDIYFSETQARVEISDSPTWDLKSHREVLKPLSWSDSSIDVRLNKFAFEDLDGSYLYVIDKSGNVNSKGFPLCGSCPNSPIMIMAN